MSGEMDFINSTIMQILEKGRAKGLTTLNEHEKVVYLVAELDTVAAMEGLFGFYPCVGGEQAVAAVDALEKIGALESAELIRRANSLFPGGSPPKEPARLHKILNSLGQSQVQQINQIGYQFLQRPDELEKKLHVFISGNKRRFSE